MLSDDADLLREFLVESRENLDRLENELMSYEGQATSGDMLAAVFRSMHTVKGTAGFFGFDHLQHVTHIAENLLGVIRDGALAMTVPIASCLLDVVDAARSILNTIEATGAEGPHDHSTLLVQLAGFHAAADIVEEAGDVAEGVEEEEEAPAPDADAAPPAPALLPVAVAPAPVAVAAAEVPVAAAEVPVEAAQAVRVESTVRVDTSVLDRLMDLAGELVLARNQLLQIATGSADSRLVRVAQRLDTVTSDLQGGVMRTRMQPIGNAWSKLPRVVRDLSGELGKKIRLQLEGQDTALDRTILEAIKDPLTHLVRNACDHGIEGTAQRVAAGKDPEGTLTLSASHGGGHVAVEITDDGGGIDPARVRRRAIERGLVTAERAARLTETEVVNLIFAAGFSTAEKVTSVSGRGVGMDVVKTNVEAIGGTVTVRSRFGEGTTIRIDIPLTLAIIPALLVSAGGQRYAIPEGALVEILRIDPEPGEIGVEYIHGAPVYRRRGELIPLAVVHDLLSGRSIGPVQLPAYVAVVAADGRKLGLVVDDLHDSEEIVVKPLARQVHDIPLYAGATILGDGRVSLILDIRGLADAMGLSTRRSSPARQDDAPMVSSRRALLIVKSRDRRLALPLGEVSRLEEFAASAVERAGGFEVVQYRNGLLPVLRLGDGLFERVTVVVHSGGGRDIGLLVDGIVDVIDVEHSIDTSTATTGVRGSTVIFGHVTDIIDVAALAAEAGMSMRMVS